MPKQLIIESFGSPETTTVYIDGVEAKDIINIQFSASVDAPRISLNIGYGLYTELKLDPKAVAELDAMAIKVAKGVKDEISNKNDEDADQSASETAVVEGSD